MTKSRLEKTANALVYGVGVNDADYPVTSKVNGKRVLCPYYSTWSGMIERCYSAKCHAKYPTYIGCLVCEEWLQSFMVFKRWMETQDHEGKELDKDLLGTGRLYSSTTCVFISPSLNKFMNANRARRGSWPIGVKQNKKRFQAFVSINGNRKPLGTFDTPAEAFAAWVAAKTKLATDLIASEKNPRIVHGINEYISRLHNN